MTEEDDMSTIQFHRMTTATPEHFVAALVGFGPGRSAVFGNSADNYLEVHAEGPAWADVTEGSGGVWERLHYDWSDPYRIVMTTADSNVWGGDSGHTYTLTRMLGFPLGTAGKRALAKPLDKTIKAIEARNSRRPARRPADR